LVLVLVWVLVLVLLVVLVLVLVLGRSLLGSVQKKRGGHKATKAEPFLPGDWRASREGLSADSDEGHPDIASGPFRGWLRSLRTVPPSSAACQNLDTASEPWERGQGSRGAGWLSCDRTGRGTELHDWIVDGWEGQNVCHTIQSMQMWQGKARLRQKKRLDKTKTKARHGKRRPD
jgi:hypothetical protein